MQTVLFIVESVFCHFLYIFFSLRARHDETIQELIDYFALSWINYKVNVNHEIMTQKLNMANFLPCGVLTAVHWNRKPVCYQWAVLTSHLSKPVLYLTAKHSLDPGPNWYCLSCLVLPVFIVFSLSFGCNTDNNGVSLRFNKEWTMKEKYHKKIYVKNKKFIFSITSQTLLRPKLLLVFKLLFKHEVWVQTPSKAN